MQENAKQILNLEDRKLLNITGVCEIESSDDSIVKLDTNMGKLIICGTNLTIGKINTESGEFSLGGYVKKIEFKTSSKNNKFSSLFK